MGICDGRVVIVTGAGRGIGREHALAFAAEGAKVVVNDLGAGLDGSDVGEHPAEQVVAEIKAAGGEAVVNGNDISSWDGAKELVQQAIDTFGGLDVLVNNAGFLRDKMLVGMSEEEWDKVITVHLKGHYAPLRHAGQDGWLLNVLNTLHGPAGGFTLLMASMGLGAMVAVMLIPHLREKYTRDHIVPRSRGGPTSWLNLVAACAACNGFKRDRTPEQAGMRLRMQPFVPTAADLRQR